MLSGVAVESRPSRLEAWGPRPLPPRDPMTGRSVQLEPFAPDRHAADLYDAYVEDGEGAVWRYALSGPFATREDYVAHARAQMTGDDPMFFAIIDLADGRVAQGHRGYVD